MRVNVKLFAVLRERAGMGEVSLDLQDGQTVREAAMVLGERVPQLAGYLNRVAYAVNHEYVPTETVLHDGDELAVIPPVSGGCE